MCSYAEFEHPKGASLKPWVRFLGPKWLKANTDSYKVILWPLHAYTGLTHRQIKVIKHQTAHHFLQQSNYFSICCRKMSDKESLRKEGLFWLTGWVRLNPAKLGNHGGRHMRELTTSCPQSGAEWQTLVLSLPPAFVQSRTAAQKMTSPNVRAALPSFIETSLTTPSQTSAEVCVHADWKSNPTEPEDYPAHLESQNY